MLMTLKFNGRDKKGCGAGGTPNGARQHAWRSLGASKRQKALRSERSAGVSKANDRPAEKQNTMLQLGYKGRNPLCNNVQC